MIKDLSQLREAERHFKESEKRLRTIFDKASDLILIHRSSEEIIEVNSIADQLLGFSPEELKGKKLEGIVVPEERERLREFLSQLRKGEFSRIELQLCDRSGRRVPVEMNSHMLDEETIMSIARDITQRKRAEELQADFIRAVVHDLGNPISAIKASLEMVPDSIKKGEKRDLIEIVHRNTERLHNLAHSLLTSIKLEAGELKLVKKEVNLSQFLLDFLLQQRPLAEQKSIEVISRIPPLPALIQGDPDRLGEIFSNIWANSIKFTPHSGKIEISFEEKNGWAVVKISNNGPPISPEDQEHLFEKFYRGKSGMGGTGLGLYIARWLTEVHGGSISVESSEEGTTFTVKLPALKS
ncbi:MAG: sensor histidine kinase [bacterium]